MGKENDMIEKIADKMFELITSKGEESLKQLKEQYNNQTILYGIVKHFGESDYFKNEFRDILYFDRKDIILQIPEEKISPLLEIRKISDNLYEPFTHIFIGKIEDIRKITEVLTTEYLSKRNLTIKLLELAMAEKESTEHILQNIGETRAVVEKINNYNEIAEYRKQQVLKKGLGRKMDLFINSAASHYLTWVNKGKLTHRGDDTPVTLQYMEQIKGMIDEGFPQITEKFHKIPVRVPIIDKLPFETQEISSIDYAIYMRTILERKSDELLKISNFLPDDFMYILFELLDLFERNPLYNVKTREFAKIVINSKPVDEDDSKNKIREELIMFGRIILKFKPIYQIYLT